MEIEPSYLYMHSALETSPAEVWVLGVGMTLLLFLSARYFPWSLLLVTPVAAAILWSRLAIVLHPGLAEDLIRMGALNFVLGTWLSLGFAVFGFAVGILLRLRARTSVAA